MSCRQQSRAADGQCGTTCLPCSATLFSPSQNIDHSDWQSWGRLYLITRLNNRVHKEHFLVCGESTAARPTCSVNPSWHKRKMICPQISTRERPLPSFPCLHRLWNIIPIQVPQFQFSSLSFLNSSSDGFEIQCYLHPFCLHLSQHKLNYNMDSKYTFYLIVCTDLTNLFFSRFWFVSRTSVKEQQLLLPAISMQVLHAGCINQKESLKAKYAKL